MPNSVDGIYWYMYSALVQRLFDTRKQSITVCQISECWRCAYGHHCIVAVFWSLWFQIHRSTRRWAHHSVATLSKNPVHDETSKSQLRKHHKREKVIQEQNTAEHTSSLIQFSYLKQRRSAVTTAVYRKSAAYQSYYYGYNEASNDQKIQRLVFPRISDQLKAFQLV